jgi:hypothetical protein
MKKVDAQRPRGIRLASIGLHSIGQGTPRDETPCFIQDRSRPLIVVVQAFEAKENCA